MKILVTGGTGFLGPHVVKSLESEFGDRLQLTLLSRKKGKAREPSGSIKYLECDLTNWNAGLESDEIENSKGQYDVFLHMAGLYNLRVTPEDAYLNNVFATHTALVLSQRLEIPTFVHISTVAVTMGHGDTSYHRSQETLISRPGFFKGPEDASSDNRPLSATVQSRGPFPDSYSESKANAEKTVRAWESDFPKRKLIIRPGIIVGASDGTPIQRIDGPYHAIDAFRRMRSIIEAWRGTIVIPGRKNHPIPLVPVDFAGQAIVRLLSLFLNSKETTSSYYVAPGTGPTIETLFQSALENLGLHRTLKTFERLPDALVKPAAEWLARLPREEIEYVLNLPALDTSETDQLLGPGFFPTFKDYESALWKGYHAYIQSR